jgi:hypothetical protein
MDITFRRESRRDRWLGWFDELPMWQRAAVVAVPAGLITLAVVARKRMWQGVAVAASAVEEVADTVEDAAESVRDTARERAGAKS